MKQQLLLDFGPPPASFDNFVIGQNLEVVHRLQDWVNGNSTEYRQFYLWGEPGCGCSHLLKAVAARAPGYARLINPHSPAPLAFEFDPTIVFYLIDDCHELSDAQQVAAFHLFNQIRQDPQAGWVAAGRSAPQHLKLRPDLQTRLSWGLVFKLQPLNDTAKAAALMQAAHSRGFLLSQQACQYLLTHCDRDMGSLIHLLQRIDHVALQEKRTISLGLLREVLAEEAGAGR